MTPQAKFTKDELTKFCEVLDVATVEASGEIGEHWWPNRGQLGPIPPQDPVIYRLYEVRCTVLNRCQVALYLISIQGVLVYGHAIKVSTYHSKRS